MNENLVDLLKTFVAALGPIGAVVFVFCLIAFLITKNTPKYSGLEQAKIHKAILWVAIIMLVVGAVSLFLRFAGLLDIGFSIPGNVRCPGGGGDNDRHETVSYTAPLGAEIVAYTIEQGASNDGNTGAPVAKPDEDGRLRTVTVRISCNPSSRIGSGGGWNNIKLVGKYRH